MHLDPRTLRGLAHPLRVRILDLLRERGPATATLLAERLAQSTGATSYHLRQLAQYGFVVEAPDLATGRERWWRAAHRNTVLEQGVGAAAPEETDLYLRSVATIYADRVQRWLGERPALPLDWRGGATLSNWRLRLTPGEAAELRDELVELIGRYRPDDAAEPAPPEAELVVLQAQLMPFLTVAAEAEAGSDSGPGSESGAGSAAEPGSAAAS